MTSPVAIIGLIIALLFASSMPSLGDDISNGSYSTSDDSNNASPPNGWPAGMFPNQVEPAARANMGAVARWWERANPHIVASWSGSVYTISTSNSSYPTAYTQGEVYCAKAGHASTGNDLLRVNNLAALPLYVQTSSGLVQVSANTIQLGAMFCAAYDSARNSGDGGFQVITNVVTASGGGGGGGTSASPVILASGNVPTGGSTVVSIDLTPYVSSYSRFEIKLNHVNPGLSMTGVTAQFSTNGGSTWLSSGYSWRSVCLCTAYSATSSSVSGDTAQVHLEDNPTGAFVNGTVELTLSTTTLLKSSLSPNMDTYVTGGTNSAHAITGILITATGGNVSAGTYDLVGYP